MSLPASTADNKGSIQTTFMLGCFVPTFVDGNEKKTYFVQKCSTDQKTANASAQALANLNSIPFNGKEIKLDRPIVTISPYSSFSWGVMEISKHGSKRDDYRNKTEETRVLYCSYADQKEAEDQAKAYADKNGLPYDSLLGTQLACFYEISRADQKRKEKVQKEEKLAKLKEMAESKLNNPKFS